MGSEERKLSPAPASTWLTATPSTSFPTSTSSSEERASPSRERTTCSGLSSRDRFSASLDSWDWTSPWDPGGSLEMYSFECTTLNLTWLTPELDSLMPSSNIFVPSTVLQHMTNVVPKYIE